MKVMVMPASEHPAHYRGVQLKGIPFFGKVFEAVSNSLELSMNAAALDADYIVTHMMGLQILQINHPDLVRYVLMDNHKNYRKNNTYIRFESVGGLGLLTSHGEKWKKDRQKIQPLFHRQIIMDNHYATVNEVSEKYKQAWLEKTKNSQSFELNITEEMASITTEVIMKTVFGNQIGTEEITAMRRSFQVLINYLKNIRVIPHIDLRQAMKWPAYFEFNRARAHVYAIIDRCADQYRLNAHTEEHRSMLSLLVEAQQKDPDHFTNDDIRDQCATMIFAGFETTAILMQWLWYVLSDEREVVARLRHDIIGKAPVAGELDSAGLGFEQVSEMEYLSMVLKETMRLYPPFWITGREPLEDDYWGDFRVKKKTTIAIPQIAFHRSPRWWKDPETFDPERFSAENEKNIIDGTYFPFSLGPRKCIGAFFAEMEAKTIMAKLIPLFDVVALNKTNNALDPAISLKLKKPLICKVSRAA